MIYILVDTYVDNYCTCGIYFHGQLADIIGTYIAVVPYSEWDNGYILTFDEGEHEVIVKTNSGDIEAIMFYWKDTSIGRTRGLICLPSDASSIEYAKKCYTDKRYHL